MPDQSLTCPQCGYSIPLNQALTDQVRQQVEHQFKHKLQEKEKEFAHRQTKLLELQKKLEVEKQSVAEQITKQLESEKKKIWAIAQSKAAEKQAVQLKDLQSQITEQQKKILESEKAELALRKKNRDLAEREAKMELEIARKLDEERKKVVDQTIREQAEQQRLKMQEKDKQMEILKKTIEDLKRQSEQGSMQIQGEVQEDDLKQLLAQTFPADSVDDVPTGITGADLVQAVNAKLGGTAGIILWESKNTKVFSQNWITKLKQDQGKVKADVSILVTQVLPKEISSFALVKGVWVVGYNYVVPLAMVLRSKIIDIARTKQSLEGQDEKMALLHQYLTGPEFKNRVENMVMAFVNMKAELDKEKRSLTNIWRRREKEIDRMLMSTSSLYGDLQGIIGGALSPIEQLELGDGE